MGHGKWAMGWSIDKMGNEEDRHAGRLARVSWFMRSEWSVGPDDAGIRLDKFLADPGRLGSRGRASDALARGKVIVNDADASSADAGRRLAAGDRVRLWVDRPGTSRRRL